MNVTAQIQYNLQVSPEEINLIGLALCGRLKPTQVKDAIELNLRLLESKRFTHQEFARLAQKALDSFIDQ